MGTRWHPDTCGCILDVEDWDAPQATFVARCPRHAGAAAPDLLVENRNKNFVVGDLVEQGIEHSWSIGDDGALEVVAPKLTVLERVALRSRLGVKARVL